MKKKRLATFKVQVVLQILLFISSDEGITLFQKSKMALISSILKIIFKSRKFYVDVFIGVHHSK